MAGGFLRGRAVIDDPDLVEDLEGIHEAEDESDEDDRSQNGQDDLLDPLSQAGAIDGGGLQLLLRERGDPGVEDEHHEGHAQDDVHEEQ